MLGSRDAERARARRPSSAPHGAANEDAVRGADLAVLAVEAGAALDGARDLRGALGKTPLLSVASSPAAPAACADPDARSLAERIQELVDAPVAAGLHSIAAANLAAERPDEDAFVCGDDARAKELGLELAAKLVAGRALDAGPLASARTLEGMTAVIVNLNRRYKAHAGVRISGLAVISIVPVEGLPEIEEGDDLGALIARRPRARLEDGDVVVVAQKAVSKAEGRVVRIEDVEASERARELAGSRDPREVEIVLRETARIVRARPPFIIAETRHGFVCASAGVDHSNAPGPGTVVLLPLDPDESAARIRDALRERTGREVGVIVSDSFGRPFRHGTTDVAIGVAGMEPLLDLRGHRRPRSATSCRSSRVAIADELAGAADLARGKHDGEPGRRRARGRTARRRRGRELVMRARARPFPLERFERERREPLADQRRELEAVAAAGRADDDPPFSFEQELVVLPRRVHARLDPQGRPGAGEPPLHPGRRPPRDLRVGPTRLVRVDRRRPRLVLPRLQAHTGSRERVAGTSHQGLRSITDGTGSSKEKYDVVSRVGVASTPTSAGAQGPAVTTATRARTPPATTPSPSSSTEST